MPASETARLIAELALRDKLTPGVNTALGSVGRLEKGIGRVGKGAGQMASGFARAGTIIGAAAIGGIGAAAKLGGDFEASLRTINTIARESDDGLTRIGDSIRAIARETGTPLDDLTNAYYDLLSAGIKTADAQGVLTNANKLAIGGLATTAQTVDLLTTAINAYGGDASKAAEYTDDFAKAIEVGKVTADEIAASFADVGAIAAQNGISVREVAASYGYLTAQGIPAASVTTQMSRAILELIKPSKTLEGLQRKLGKNYSELARKKGLVPALEELRKDADKAGVPLVNLFGRVEGFKFLLETTGPQNAGFNEVMRQMGDDAGTAAAQMAERQQGLNFQLSLLKANLKDAGLELASGFLPALTRSTSKLTAALNDPGTRAALRSIGEDIGRAIDDIDWQAVVRGAKEFVGVMKIAFDWAKRMFDIFNALPTEIKGAAAGFLALNKLSGGLVGAGLGNIVGGLGETITRSLGARLPGVGKAFVQPVFVTNMPVGGIGGLGGAGGAAGAVGGMGLLAAFGSLAFVAAIELAIADAVGPAFRKAFGLADAGTAGAGQGRQIPGTPIKVGVSQAAIVHPLGEVIRKENTATRDAQRHGNDSILRTLKKSDDRAATALAVSREARDRAQATAFAVRDAEGTIRSSAAKTASAARDAGRHTATALRRLPAPSVSTRVYVNVTPGRIQEKHTIATRYGPVNSSHGSAELQRITG